MSTPAWSATCDEGKSCAVIMAMGSLRLYIALRVGIVTFFRGVWVAGLSGECADALFCKVASYETRASDVVRGRALEARSGRLVNLDGLTHVCSDRHSMLRRDCALDLEMIAQLANEGIDEMNGISMEQSCATMPNQLLLIIWPRDPRQASALTWVARLKAWGRPHKTPGAKARLAPLSRYSSSWSQPLLMIIILVNDMRAYRALMKHIEWVGLIYGPWHWATGDFETFSHLVPK